jgi:RNA-binding protein YhbY
MIELKLKIYGRRLMNLPQLQALFSELKDGEYLLTIKNIRKRTLQQNAYYWGVVVPLVKKALRDAGFDEVDDNEAAHEVMKVLFLKREIVNKQTGEMISLPVSSTKLTVPEFNEYLEKVCKWAAEYLDTVIPSPNSALADFDDYVEKSSF